MTATAEQRDVDRGLSWPVATLVTLAVAVAVWRSGAALIFDGPGRAATPAVGEERLTTVDWTSEPVPPGPDGVLLLVPENASGELDERIVPSIEALPAIGRWSVDAGRVGWRMVVPSAPGGFFRAFVAYRSSQATRLVLAKDGRVVSSIPLPACDGIRTEEKLLRLVPAGVWNLVIELDPVEPSLELLSIRLEPKR